MEISFWGQCRIDDEMSEEEIKYKKRFERSGGGDEPMAAEKYPLTWKMAEQDFFDLPYDVNVVPHGRYTPMFLHEHEFIEMVFVFSGQCVNEIAGHKAEMFSGDVCLIAPGTKHALGVFDDDTVVLNFLIRTSTFEKAFFNILSGTSILADFFRHIFYSGQGNSYLIFRTGTDWELRYYLGRIYEEIQDEIPDKNEMADTLLTMFFLLLIRRYGSKVILPQQEAFEEESAGREINPVQILKYMQENYKAANLREMSGYFHYSERHMKRLIVRCTGRSFSENILSIRMNEAARLLEKTRLPVETVALNVGYGEPSGFRLAFKKYFGKSPGKYRREVLA